MLDSWISSYNLKERLRVPPDQTDAILGDLDVCNRIVFFSQVGIDTIIG